jgi:hypothetical protein
MSEGPCRCNPWADALLVCHACEDTGRSAANRDYRGSNPCPFCGTPDRREPMQRERNHQTMPTLKRSDLTAEEEQLVKEWRLKGYHELDCLRWTEGARYDPEKDPEFLSRCDRELLKSAFLHEQAEPSFHKRFKKPLTET